MGKFRILFLTLLPQQDNFRSSLEKTEQYKKIKEHFKNVITKAYSSFMTYAAQHFEVFLRKFPYAEPIIHVLFPGMIEMIRTIMTKIVRKTYLVTAKPDGDFLKVMF